MYRIACTHGQHIGLHLHLGKAVIIIIQTSWWMKTLTTVVMTASAKNYHSTFILNYSPVFKQQIILLLHVYVSNWKNSLSPCGLLGHVTGGLKSWRTWVRLVWETGVTSLHWANLTPAQSAFLCLHDRFASPRLAGRQLTAWCDNVWL